ncbi:MAG: hypothetical protein B7733_04180 [Myxococcales bacterium FL481]|nr:MAG: hypothetical protein B7733_04180 [Myxococcales bacterium FL481]
MLARVSTSMLLCSSLVVAACGGGESSNTTADALAKLDQKAQAEKRRAEAEKAPPPKKKAGLAPGAVGAPWQREAVSGSLKTGTVLEYAQSGTDTKGKKVTDTYRCQVKKNDDKAAGIVCVQVEHPSKDPGAGQIATISWSKLSPFFAVERPSPEFAAREKVTVPAGEFDCVKAELKGFMGNHKTVWMAVDKPGIYAKVVDHGNANAPDDKTEMTYELKVINPAAG